MLSLSYPHIETRSDGIVVIAGTQIKVIEVAMDHLAHHWTAEDIQHQYPELTLGQIHSALAFYFDNEADLTSEIEEQLKREDRLLSAHSNTALRAKLLAARQV